MPLKVTLSILWRSFFVQAAWNFKAMQNIGFTNAILPGLKHIDPGNLSISIRRYCSFFNTQPYMAPTIIGVYLHLHERNDEETIEKIGPSLSGSLAAIGDTFFWATLKPILALSLLASVIMDQPWGIFLALILYNTVHIWTMAWGYMKGYLNGPDGALALGHVLSIDLARDISLLIPFLSGVLLSLASDWGKAGPGITAGVILFIACIPLIRLGLSIYWLVYGAFTLSMIWTML